MSKKINKKNILLGTAVLGGFFVGMTFAAKKLAENCSIDENNSYIENEKTTARSVTRYEKYVKPAMDKLLSFVGLIVLSPLFVIISLAIIIDDPGSVFFTQCRVGKNKHFFYLHKFRSMKMSTPHDVPTHQLENPEKYITRIGRILRKTSLDELPQIWDIFRGKMSIIGPRPALWNQDDLVTEREKYGANDIIPGLTGWAQINGRDKLEIEDKAQLDGEYVKKISLFFDCRCFIATLISVMKSDGIVEGDTGKVYKPVRLNDGNTIYDEDDYQVKK